MKLFIRSIFITILCSNILASECFNEHISNAIKKNQARRSLYAELTKGKSLKISNRLIFAEKIAYSYSHLLKDKLKEYRDAGIPILCFDFIPMDETPLFKGRIKIPKNHYQEITPRRLKKTLKKLLKEEKYIDIVNFIEDEISKIQYKNYNCMVKHVLESLGRTAFLTPHYIKHSRALGLKSPKRLLNKFLKQNINTLNFMHHLDKSAYKFQKNGIPILCGDVPEIPIRLDYEMELSKY